jgi:hypothetical protein
MRYAAGCDLRYPGREDVILKAGVTGRGDRTQTRCTNKVLALPIACVSKWLVRLLFPSLFHRTRQRVIDRSA